MKQSVTKHALNLTLETEQQQQQETIEQINLPNIHAEEYICCVLKNKIHLNCIILK